MNKKPFKGKIRVLERLKFLIPVLDKDEYRVLEQSLKEEGRAYSALWLWGDILVDGHHRYEICTKHKIPYDVLQVYESAKTIEDVEYRMRRDTIGRRNLDTAVMSRLRAQNVLYHIECGKGKQEAVRLVAEESSVSERQVYRDVERVELVETVVDEAKSATDAMSVPAIKELAEMPKAKQKAVVKKAGGDGKKVEKEIKKAKGKEKASAARLFEAMQKQHFSGKTGLPQTIDAMAEANGGKGGQYEIADTSLETFLKATSQMRDGKK
jgi:ParB-like chromosome segregation protein Spo0J